MAKGKLKILTVDRPLRQGEHPVRDIFDAYREKGYDMIIFPWKEDKPRTEVVVFSHDVLNDMRHVFEIPHKEYSEDEILYDFDLEGIDEQTFYDILYQHFEIIVSNLTEVERR